MCVYVGYSDLHSLQQTLQPIHSPYSSQAILHTMNKIPSVNLLGKECSFKKVSGTIGTSAFYHSAWRLKSTFHRIKPAQGPHVWHAQLSRFSLHETPTKIPTKTGRKGSYNHGSVGEKTLVENHPSNQRKLILEIHPFSTFSIIMGGRRLFQHLGYVGSPSDFSHHITPFTNSKNQLRLNTWLAYGGSVEMALFFDTKLSPKSSFILLHVWNWGSPRCYNQTIQGTKVVAKTSSVFFCQRVWYRYNSLYGLCWGNPLTSQRHKSALTLLFCFDTYRYGKVFALSQR